MMTAFFAAGSLYLFAAAGLAILTASGLLAVDRWFLLHLVFVGGISQLVFGASQFFATAFLATEPPPTTLVRRQLVAWNLGSLLVIAGVGAGWDAVALVGGLALAAGLALLWHSYESLKKGSLQTATWAVRWYSAAILLFAPGIALGVLLTFGVSWPHGSLLGAHLALNLAGWFGSAIVGTLHTFYPSLTHTQLAYPRLQRPAFYTWVGGSLMQAVALAFGIKLLSLPGWALLAAAAILLTLNLVASTRRAERALAMAPRLIAVAQVCLVAGLLTCLVVTAGGSHLNPLFGSARPPVALLLLAGWLGLTVIASMIHLLSVAVTVAEMKVLGPGRGRPAAAGPGGRTLAALAAIGVAVCVAASAIEAGIWADRALVAGAAILAAVYVAVAVKVAVVMVRLLRARSIRA